MFLPSGISLLLSLFPLLLHGSSQISGLNMAWLYSVHYIFFSALYFLQPGIYVLIFMFLLFIFWRTNTYNNESKNLIYFCVFFSITLLLAIGFSVNNLGAIVRYRSVIIPLLVIPMAAYINWNQILSFFVNNIRNKNNISNSA